MFVVFGLPSVVLGILTLRGLPDSPQQAPWLTPLERAWLADQVAKEHIPMADPPLRPVLTALRHRRLLAHAGVYAGLYFALYQLQFFLPQMVSDLGGGRSATWTTGVIALCYTGAAAAMLAWSRRSDHTGERINHLALPTLTAAALALTQVAGSPLWEVAAMALALACVLAAVPVFWSLPMTLPAGFCAAAGVAAVNSLSSIASFLAPYVTGVLKDLTGGYGTALLLAALLLLLSGSGTLLMNRAGRPHPTPASPARTAQADADNRQARSGHPPWLRGSGRAADSRTAHGHREQN
ncbi:hypothetical protein AQJ91_46275 [Streptomyces dysideae]|uniref:Major facilitator superfamily (MFS) profile domain-containing protein n=2 Tax=Streptomyces dysideae TaxID=909626 RepID=A0A101UPM7_9ACTN|nr:hypothetical protein AQJ91_46275 [Streptomyces dysideae]